MSGRDYYYRPIIKINYSKFDSKNLENYINAVFFFLEFITNNCLVPGKVEN